MNKPMNNDKFKMDVEQVLEEPCDDVMKDPDYTWEDNRCFYQGNYIGRINNGIS